MAWGHTRLSGDTGVDELWIPLTLPHTSALLFRLFTACQGEFEVGYRITVAARDGKVRGTEGDKGMGHYRGWGTTYRGWGTTYRGWGTAVGP